MNKVQEQIEGLHDIADEQVLPEHYQLHKTADTIESMQARIELLEKENELLRADNIRVRGVLQVLNPEALAVADAALKEQTL